MSFTGGDQNRFLALLPTRFIIDQHFLRKHRQARLEEAVSESPRAIGIGGDAKAGIAVKSESSLELIRNSTVTFVEGVGREKRFVPGDRLERSSL